MRMVNARPCPTVKTPSDLQSPWLINAIVKKPSLVRHCISLQPTVYATKYWTPLFNSRIDEVLVQLIPCCIQSFPYQRAAVEFQ